MHGDDRYEEKCHRCLVSGSGRRAASRTCPSSRSLSCYAGLTLGAAPGDRRGYGKPINATNFERLNSYHAQRHSSISVLAVEGNTRDQIAALAGHLERRTTQRYVHFTPKDPGRRQTRFRSGLDGRTSKSMRHCFNLSWAWG